MTSKSLIKYLLLILAGIAISLVFLGVYTRLITPVADTEDLQTLPPVNIVDKDVFISAITGEVFIIRDEIIKAAIIGDALFEGDVLKVVDQSYCQIQFSDRGSAGLDSNTVMLLKRLVNADNLSIRTEVLMGSMMYKVKKLEDKDDFQVESEGVVYDVKGTEFLVVNSKDGYLLAVREGEVSLSSESYDVSELSVKGGEEIFLLKDDFTVPAVIPMGESASERIEKLEGIDTLTSLNNPSVFKVNVNPSGAEIYINGRKTGTDQFTGLFEEGSELDLLVRKRGYKDKTVHHIIDSSKSQEISIQLLPLGLAETLDIKNLPIESLLEDKIIRQEQELVQLRDTLQKEKRNYETDRENRERDKSLLLEEIEQKNEEIIQLKQLMIQIRELSEQE